MAHGNASNTIEMGPNGHEPVFKSKKPKKFVISAIVLIIIAIVVLLIIVLISKRGGDTNDSETKVDKQISKTESGKDPITLEEILSNYFPSEYFNGSWISGKEFLYQNENDELMLYDTESNSARPFLSNGSEFSEQRYRYKLSSDLQEITFAYHIYMIYRYSFLAYYTVINVKSGEIKQNYSEPLQNFKWGPMGTQCVYVHKNDVFYQSDVTAEPRRLTYNGQPDVIYNGIPDWVYEEEIFESNTALWFSKDGTKLAFATFNDTDVDVMSIPYYTSLERANYSYPSYHNIRYPKSGTNNPTVTVTLTNLKSNINKVFSAPDDIDKPILKKVAFANNDTIAILWSNREQTVIRAVFCSLERLCYQIYQYSETNGWINNIPFMFNEQGTAFITILPQSVKGGDRYKQIVQVSDEGLGNWTSQDRTNTPHTVKDILYWSKDDEIWYKATSVEDSSHQHLYRVSSVGAVSCVSCAGCSYSEAELSADGSRFALTCAGPDVPETNIYYANNTRLKVWSNNSDLASFVKTKAIPVKLRMTVPTAEGYPDADVMIEVPYDYKNRTKIPLLVNVYGGPDSSQVTSTWSVDWGSSMVSRWGIAIARIDARGSAFRGVTNTFALYRRLGSVEIEDQIHVTRYLQDNLKWLDKNRTCIWGWSYGGFASSLALMRGGDVFRCAAAVAPVVDWRYYDSMYTERYMGLPSNNLDGYRDSSMLTREVKTLKEKSYCLVHGSADDNVHYQQTMLLSKLLQAQDIPFTQMSYTDEQHGLQHVRPHLYHLLESFFKENML